MLFSRQFGLTVVQMNLYSSELVGIHPLLALSVTISPDILFSIIVHSLLLCRLAVTVICVRVELLALGHGGEHGVQGGGVVGDETDLGHTPVRLHLILAIVIPTCVWGGHWSAFLVHQPHIYHEVEALLVELSQIPGHSMHRNVLVFQTESLSLDANPAHPCLRDVERAHAHRLPPC